MASKTFQIISTIVTLSFFAVIFSPIVLKNQLPIPADTIVGLYHPFRDYLSGTYPRGIPFKNPLTTDPVRQQYPWRELAITEIKSNSSPSWNPYIFAGTPLLGNPQSAAFYPLNVIYLLTSFVTGWTWQIIVGSIIGAFLMYLFLVRRITQMAAVIGSLAWVGSGFFVAWSTLNTLTQSAIWLPLILLSIELILAGRQRHVLTLAFALAASFLAGAWQIFIYIILFSVVFTLREIVTNHKTIKFLPHVLSGALLGLILTLPQLLSSWSYFSQGIRSVETAFNLPEGWFMPAVQLIQFLIPDYFGNPATGNYFGTWNYMEFVGFIGVIPLVFAAIFSFSHPRKSSFWIGTIILLLASMLPNPIMTFYAQPTRALVLVCFSLSVLSSFGVNGFLTGSLKIRNILPPLAAIALIFLVSIFLAVKSSLTISVRNSLLPLTIFLASTVLIFIGTKKWTKVIFIMLSVITVFDLSRFYLKFTPFSNSKWLYPETSTILFLKNNLTDTPYRFLSLDDRLMPPNFSVFYRLPTVSGYDSTIPARFAELVTAIERGKPDISRPWGYNRIVSPKNYRHSLFPIFSIKYFLTLENIANPQLKLVHQEGQTRVYESIDALPRLRSVTNLSCQTTSNNVLIAMFAKEFDPRLSAICLSNTAYQKSYTEPKITNLVYQSGRISFNTDSDNKSFLVLSENYFPGWTVNIDNKPLTPVKVNYAFQGVEVPIGKHKIIWQYH